MEIRLGDSAANNDAGFAARLLAFLFGAGGTLGILVVVLPHPDAVQQMGVLVVALAACATAAFLLFSAGRCSAASLQAFVALGTLLIAAALHFSARSTVPFELFYVWVGLFAFYFFDGRAAVAQVAFAAAAYAAARLVGADGRGSFVTSWLLTGGTTLVAGTMVSRLVGQVRAQSADVEAVIRVSREFGRGGAASSTREAICEAAREVSAAAASALFELDPGRRLLVCSAAAAGGTAPRLRLALEDRSYGTVAAFQTGSPQFIADLAADPRLAPALAGETPLGSCVCQPVIRDSASVGVLVVVWHRRIKRVPRRVASVIALLAAEAATAIERDDLLARLGTAASTDELTGLANRRALHAELTRELARAAREKRPLCVAILDLDHFKTFNDERGHQAGDALLRDAAAAWGAVLRPTDVLARYGGDEFVVLLPSCPLEDAYPLLDRIRAVVPQRQRCSAGIACWDGEESRDALIHRADVALYRAKRSGRDGIILDAAAPTAPANTG